MNPFASLTVTYVVGAVASTILFFILGKNGNLVKEYSRLNWAPAMIPGETMHLPMFVVQ